jgi:putative tryptophan/tyrosine transport system substrate-binding protein
MRRRQFVTLLGGAALAPAGLWLRPLMAQQADRVRRVGVLMPSTETDAQAQAEVRVFRDEFQKLGWTDGKNVRIELRWAGGEMSQIRTHGKELVALQPDVIVGRSTPVTTALMQESRTIPIVFLNVSDPVGSGIAASMARPGGNATGFTNVEASLGGKWVEVLKEINPRIARVAALFGARTSPEGGAFYLRLIENAARSIAVETIAAPVQETADIERTVERLAREPNVGMIVMPDVTTTSRYQLIVSLAARHGVPAIYSYRHIVAGGGLASYGLDVTDAYRQAARYADRILRGEKPSELPVQGPVKFELAINLKTAKSLGLEPPPMLLGRADDVID